MPWLILAVLAVGVALAAPLLPRLAPIDLGHYLQASRLILSGEIPYGRVEFFGPPRFAIFMLPFLLMPAQVAGSLWTLLAILAISSSALQSASWLTPARKGLLPVLTTAGLAAAPPALYVYVTGQISGVVGFALIHLARSLNRDPGMPNRLSTVLAVTVLSFMSTSACFQLCSASSNWCGGVPGRRSGRCSWSWSG